MRSQGCWTRAEPSRGVRPRPPSFVSSPHSRAHRSACPAPEASHLAPVSVRSRRLACCRNSRRGAWSRESPSLWRVGTPSVSPAGSWMLPLPSPGSCAAHCGAPACRSATLPPARSRVRCTTCSGTLTSPNSRSTLTGATWQADCSNRLTSEHGSGHSATSPAPTSRARCPDAAWIRALARSPRTGSAMIDQRRGQHGEFLPEGGSAPGQGLDDLSSLAGLLPESTLMAWRTVAPVVPSVAYLSGGTALTAHLRHPSLPVPRADIEGFWVRRQPQIVTAVAL